MFWMLVVISAILNFYHFFMQSGLLYDGLLGNEGANKTTHCNKSEWIQHTEWYIHDDAAFLEIIMTHTSMSEQHLTLKTGTNR